MLSSIINAMNELDFSPQNITNFLNSNRRSPVILCIGTDRVCGDALGPLVGTLLTSQFNVPSFVYGTLDRPITALNLSDAVQFISSHHALCPIIAIDSCVGRSDEVGKIRLFNGGIKPGLATGKNLPKVGDISITATVARSGNENSLFRVSLSLIYSLSLNIASKVNQAVKSANTVKPSTIHCYNTTIV